MENPHKKYALYNQKTGEVNGIKATYLEEGHPHTICGEHIVLANMINDANIDPELKKELLEKVDIVYDMGKRMGNKLVEYHQKYVKVGGWREGF